MNDNELIFKLRVPIKVIGMTTGYTDPALLMAIPTGEKTPIKVIGMTTGYEDVKCIITLLSAEDLKKFE